MPQHHKPAGSPLPAMSDVANSPAAACWLVAVLTIAFVAGRIAVVSSSTGETPFLSANDRSRWATVASLVDRRTYSIDALQNYRDPITQRRTWQTIDRVQHRDGSGKVHNYSSKPPLLPTLVAIPYAVLKSVTGWSFVERPMLVGRLLLAIVNLPMLAILFATTIRLIVRYHLSIWTSLFLAVAATCGTLLTPFAITFNNHLPAATSVMVVLWLLDTQARKGARWLPMFAVGAGLAFSVANELPSLAIVPLWIGMALLIKPQSQNSPLPVAIWKRPQWAILAGVLLVATPFFATNWIAHQSWRPPYAHRNVGPELAILEVQVPADAPQDQFQSAIAAEVAKQTNQSAQEWKISPARSPQTWRLDSASQTLAIRNHASPGQQPVWKLHVWDDWYDYPGTYWTDAARRGIDQGEASRWRYAWHALLGHHGVFSLTPIWCLAVLGCCLGCRSLVAKPTATVTTPAFASRISPQHPKLPKFPALVHASIGLTTFVCTAFYLSRPLIDRNYGGVSICFRWLIWMAPLWIYLAFPAVEQLSRSRRGRVFCLSMLAMSLFSVATAIENPWSHPWLYRWMNDLGWIAPVGNR